jgi:transaldolase/glucose-6-phosphate isomerase
MNTIQKTYELGQSIWLDDIRRSLLTSGELDRLINLGLTGMTSNPTIFEKAITGSSDYDGDLIRLAGKGLSVLDIYDELTRADIAAAADLFRPVYEGTGARDGFVSLEVSPDLAHDTDRTVEEGLRLFSTLGRPNVMIKVPATPQGIPAVEKLIHAGVNVNVTLIFSIQQYENAARAYIAGLEKRAAEGKPVAAVASVASFFVSRIDSAVDQVLTENDMPHLAGKTAIASARIAYARFGAIFSGKGWEKLAAAGAAYQRPLWASTSTKNPSYPDTLYADALIGPHTVNTLPLETMNAFLDHGKPALTITEGTDDATVHLVRLKESGVEVDKVTADLLRKGVQSFGDSYRSLLDGIEKKVTSLEKGERNFLYQAGRYSYEVTESLEILRKERIMSRIWDRDHTVWRDNPAEVANRLGWLKSPVSMMSAVSRIEEMVQGVRRDGYTNALLLGMGGSSLAPDLFSKVFGARSGYLDLEVLDSTDPAAVRTRAEILTPGRTLFIVSTKSGTTSETLSFFRYFFNLTVEAVSAEKAGDHFIAITDPGSPLQSLALEYRFRDIYLNDPDIGGRYSALSYFGLVPAALLGVDIGLLLDRASSMASNCEASNCPTSGDNTGAILGSLIGTLHNLGMDKLTLLTSPNISAFGSWLEQLLAESTGKEGRGILPVEGEMPGPPSVYGSDRVFVYLCTRGDFTHDVQLLVLEKEGHPIIRIILSDLYDIGAEFFRWEVATAVAGHIIQINPFDQPNVEAAKALARSMLDEYRESGQLPAVKARIQDAGVSVFTDLEADTPGEALMNFLDQAAEGDYVAIQAYVNPDDGTADALGRLRHRIRDRFKTATTVGFGPRYLHSTGQLHKGDRGNGLFIQITSEDRGDLPIPDDFGKDGSSITFGILKAAQALGDLEALKESGRRVIRFHLKGDVVQGIRLMTDWVGQGE